MAVIDVNEASMLLLETIANENRNTQRHILMKYFEDLSSSSPVPDFENGLEWINVKEPLSFNKHLKGKLVILDFFTYCCINCMHILPDLKFLEERFSIGDGLVVIGVHSPKFLYEKQSDNVQAAVERYEITHPVVNDANESMWTNLGICCWPTLFVVGPNAEQLLVLQGEGHRELLVLFIEEALNFFGKKGAISQHSIPEISLKTYVAKENVLHYPGKVTVVENSDEELIAVADTGNHRVLLLSHNGRILKTVGGQTSGFCDGSISEAKFHSPQGLAFSDPNTLYVADTENHAIRKVDLLAESVSTVVGTGVQGNDRIGGKVGIQQEISSPWDVCFINNNSILLIAMAGTHQIWALFLQDTVWWKQKHYKAGSCAAVAGSGKEENRNNLYPMNAGFAQPSGITFASLHNSVFIADSESSSVRCLCLTDGKVTSVVGGLPDPQNLFAFGDKDGKGMEAKLQHPLGVTWSSQRQKLYVADSYNQKIKVIDVQTKVCNTVHINSNIELREPGGLCSFRDKVYIADTNNHYIRVLNTETGTLETLSIQLHSASKSSVSVLKEEKIKLHTSGGIINLETGIILPAGSYITEGAPSTWSIELPENGWKSEKLTKTFELSSQWKVTAPADIAGVCKHVIIQCKVYFCSGSLCKMESFALKIIVEYSETGQSAVQASLHCDIK